MYYFWGFAITIGLLALWGNWIYLDKTGFALSRRPSFFEFYAIGTINLFRIIMLKPVICFHELGKSVERYIEPEKRVE